MLELKKENIPEELKKSAKWVAFVNRNGKKIPIDPKPNNEFNYVTASISDPTTWGTFEQAESLVTSGFYSAVGFAMQPEDNLIFVDIDCHLEKCKSDEEREELKKKYDSLCRTVEPFNTYMERSLSGNGVHLLAKGSLKEELSTGSSPTMPLEIYGNKDRRFIIMTGQKLNDYGIEDNERTIGAIQNLHKHYFTPKTNSISSGEVAPDHQALPPIETPIRTDEEVLRIAMKNKDFELLWNGQWEQIKDSAGNQKYQQQHFADFVLIRKLTFYTGNCPEQTERLFRLSPCYQQYGKDGKWAKYESDIRKDIKTTSTTCKAVYDPNYKKENTEVANISNDLPWKPNFQVLLKTLVETDPEKRLIKSPKLIGMLKDYCVKYHDKNILYLPYLFNEDKNVNGATAIVKAVLNENLKYSFQNGDYFIWDGKRYKNYGDSSFLIHTITEIMGLVEHSVFMWVVTEVMGSNQEELEEKAISLFERSKSYVTTKMAKDVLLKYQGMNIGDDIATYYQTPYINMQNGVLDLSTRELLPHDPKYNQSKITGCDYDPTAVCPEFESMVARLVPDEEERKELQKAFGLCLAKEQLPAKKVLMLLVGPANTGKTTLLNAVIDVLGEYGKNVDNSLLMQNHKDKTRGPEMYDFKETLMISTSESNENDKLDSGKVKALTGETTQSVRLNYSNKMDKFKMIGLIFIDSNFKPYIPPRDTATWSRLRLFPFLYPVKVKDPTLKSKLAAERAGIFNWLLKGLEMVLEEKEIFETSVMLEYKEQYKKEIDTTEQFLRDCVEKSENSSSRIPTSFLYATYKNWCKDNNFNLSVRNKFYEEVAKTFEKKKSSSEYFLGIKFTELGELYSKMAEMLPTNFAKEKRELLLGSNSDLPYSVRRTIHFQKSSRWFYKVYDIMDSRLSYMNYCNWCAENAKIPIRVNDFEVKVDYLKSHNYEGKVTPKLLEEVEGVWSN